MTGNKSGGYFFSIKEWENKMRRTKRRFGEVHPEKGSLYTRHKKQEVNYLCSKTTD